MACLPVMKGGKELAAARSKLASRPVSTRVRPLVLTLVCASKQPTTRRVPTAPPSPTPGTVSPRSSVGTATSYMRGPAALPSGTVLSELLGPMEVSLRTRRKLPS